MVVHGAVSTKMTMVLIASCMGVGYVGIGLAYVLGAVSECVLVREIESRREDEKRARRREKRDAGQITVAEQEELDEETDYGDADPSELPGWALHQGGTVVRIVAGQNQGKEGVLTARRSYDERSQRYRMHLREPETVDGRRRSVNFSVAGEEWYIPRGDVVSTADPTPGARVLVLQGHNAGRVGTVGVKHDVHDLHHVVLDPTEQHPPQVFMVQKEGVDDGADGEEPSWPIAFGDGDKAQTIAKASGAARKMGLKPGMVVVRLNGGGEWAALDAAAADGAVELQLQDGWWLERSMFDCFAT